MTLPILYGFDMCPFVIRTLALMKYKGIKYQYQHVDIHNKPDWFLKISPFGVVPLLKVEDTS
jgi:glutathione S-transferase